MAEGWPEQRHGQKQPGVVRSDLGEGGWLGGPVCAEQATRGMESREFAVGFLGSRGPSATP